MSEFKVAQRESQSISILELRGYLDAHTAPKLDADLDIATRVAQALGAIDQATGALVPPVHTSTTYVRDRDYKLPGPWSYGRPDNPTVEAAEAVLASIEGGAGALLFASGTAAFTTRLPGPQARRPRRGAQGDVLGVARMAARAAAALGRRRRPRGHD